MRKPAYPKQLRAGSVVVKIYRVRHKTTKSGFDFVVGWRDADGKPRRKHFADEDAVSGVDIAPTLLELCGIDRPSPAKAVIDGRSVAALITDPSATLPPQPVFIEFGFARAIVEGDWKYIALRFPPATQQRRETSGKMPRYHGEFGNSERESLGFPSYGDADQLFDLRNDMLEQRNLAADPAHAARLADLKAKLKAKLEQIGLPFGEFVPDRPVTAARSKRATDVSVRPVTRQQEAKE